MNFIGLVVLIALVADFILHIWADALNLKCLQRHVPESFQGIYDSEQYQRSQDYLRCNTKFDWISSLFHLVIFLTFWFIEGFDFLDQWVRVFSYGPFVTGLIYLSILLSVRMVLDMPFSVYQTFVI